jgi:adenosylhomocysteine nucleosidase
MFGILIAMPAEGRCFHSSFRTLGEIYTHGPKTLIAISGMGEHASQTALRLLKKGVTCLVSCGSAAGLDPYIKPGTLCIPQQVINSEGMTYPCAGYLREQVLASIHKGIALKEGSLLHTPTILKTKSEKQALYQRSGAIASDMESFFIAQQAKQYQIPFLALRVVVDGADFNIPKQLTQCISTAGTVSLLKIFLNLCIQPSLLFPLITLANNFNKTRKVLKRVSQLEMFINYWSLDKLGSNTGPIACSSPSPPESDSF